MFVGQRHMFLLEKDEGLCAFCVTLLMCTSQQWVLWKFKPRYLAELTLFNTCPLMVYFDCSGVLVVICRTLHLSGGSCFSHWSSHFCNVSRCCCTVRRFSSDLMLRYRLIIYCFTSSSSMFHLYGDVTITCGGMQNIGLCSALRAFEQVGIFIMPHLLWHGTSVFPVSSEGPPYSVASYDTHEDVEFLLFLTWIVTGTHSLASYDMQGDAKDLF
jgi:hypothetical protein